jgi:hypothetical protein
MRFITHMAWIAVAFSASGGAWSEEAPRFDARVQGAVQVAEALHRCPNWYGTPGTDVRTREEITRIYTDLAQYDTNSVRAGIALYIQGFSGAEYERYTGAVKVFAFLRVFFEVPLTLDWHRMPYSTYGNPHLDDTKLDFLWPYSVNESGALVLTGEGIPMSGPPYDPIADFDKMEFAKLERRFPPRAEAPN